MEENNIKWASKVFAIFLFALCILNSQSFVNYSNTLDVNRISNIFRSFAIALNGNIEKIGLNGPRKLIENFGNYIEDLEFKKENKNK